MNSLYLHQKWMKQALQFAEKAGKDNEVPVGAVLVKDDVLLAGAGNATLQRCDPTAHAEILVLRRGADQLQSHRLHNTILYSTLEPCIMCLGAILQAQVSRVVFGAYDKTIGAMEALELLNVSVSGWKPDIIGGCLAKEANQLLKEFFREIRSSSQI
jgi:tRNA(adenine34) deaminase